jgi:Enoyl-(Acyl carrier protein) reductase
VKKRIEVILRRAGVSTGKEIARVAMFLATPESGYISGATLVVDVGSDEAGAYMVEKYRARPAKYEIRPRSSKFHA